MIKIALLTLLIGAGAYAIITLEKPRYVQLSAPGAVIFEPAPSTGSATFLGSITGVPGMYWNYATNVSKIPTGMVSK